MRGYAGGQVVCDVWYMEPQDQLEGETAEDFAERVQGMICRRAGITRVKWDGMLKYYRPRGTLTEKRRAVRASGWRANEGNLFCGAQREDTSANAARISAMRREPGRHVAANDVCRLAPSTEGVVK
jgi:hypothetical protein